MRETAGQAAPVLAGAPASVLNVLAVRPGRIAVLKDVPLGNGNWLIELPGGQRAVLRRYHPGADQEDLAYEHAVLDHLAAGGWVVPHPLSEPVRHDGR
jgi:Ser/Thr protein kinase RdoA (MazF antagonist)